MGSPFANFNELTIKDGEGFAVPNYGGTLAVRFNTITFGNTTAKNLFTLPKGAIPIAWITNVTTAFDDTGTDAVDIGTPSSGARFANDIDVSSVGQKNSGYVPSELFVPLAGDTQITGTYSGQNANATAGVAVVGVIYMLA
jgi:hypothetical protein